MISILGSLLGFGTSFLPSVFSFLQKKNDQKQELLLLEARAKYAQELSKYKLEELDAQAQIEESRTIYNHASELAKNNQSPFISALQASVRPVITYFFFLLFAFIKTMAVVVSIREGVDVSEAILACWDDNTAGVFSAILAFWFGNRPVARYVK